MLLRSNEGLPFTPFHNPAASLESLAAARYCRLIPTVPREWSVLERPSFG